MGRKGETHQVKRVRETVIEEVPDEEAQTGGSQAKKVGGFDSEDIAKAPAQPPKPDTSDTAADTSNRKVVATFGLAVFVGLLGLIFMMMGIITVSIPLFIISGIAVVVAVFAAIR